MSQSSLKESDMASRLPTTNLALSSIVNMFSPGQSAPYSWGNYYEGGPYVNVNDLQPNNIPINGQMGFGVFRSAFKVNSYSPFMWFRASDLTGLAHGTQISTWSSVTNSKVATGASVGAGTKPVLDKPVKRFLLSSLGRGQPLQQMVATLIVEHRP